MNFYDDYETVPAQCKDEQIKNETVVRRNIVTNKECRQYGFRVPIEGHYIWDKLSGVSIINKDADGHPTLTALTEIPGVDHLLLTSAYEIWVSKAMAFDWEEIEPKVFQILNVHNKLGL